MFFILVNKYLNKNENRSCLPNLIFVHTIIDVKLARTPIKINQKIDQSAGQHILPKTFHGIPTHSSLATKQII